MARNDDDLIGHNSRDRIEEDMDTAAAKELRQFCERIERLDEERQTIVDDIKEVKAEAKGRGYDVKALNAILKLRKKDPNERAEEEAMVNLYMNALGMA